MAEEPVKKKLSRRTLLKRGLLTAAAASLPYSMLESEWLGVCKVTVPIKDLGPEFDGYKIAQITDLHYPRNIEMPFIRRAIELAMSEKPDIFVVTGDICDGKGLSKVPWLGNLFHAASAPDGLFGVLGNHDHWFDPMEIRRQLHQHSQMRLIDNESILIERGKNALAIGGIGDLWEDRVDVVGAFKKVPKDVPRVLLSHNPDFAEDMQDDERVDLQLSGHTHGGQVRFPWGYAPIIPSKYGQKFRDGLVQGRKNLVYVSKGICAPHHVRFFCRPEVTLITLAQH